MRKIFCSLNLQIFYQEVPLFHWDTEAKRLVSEHHPFTSPHRDDLALLDTDPLQARSSSYDLVLNGYELASGSQRIHDGALQAKIFSLLLPSIITSEI